jgi:exodeoxyribonuclease VII large subunit
VGLTCYNNYELSKAIALFPIPVLTGIGHSTNETVAEMVAFKNAITPSELADYLIQQFHNFAVPVQKAQESIIDKCSRLIRDENIKIIHSVRFLKSVIGSTLIKSKNEIIIEVRSLLIQSTYFFQREKKIIENIEKNIDLMNPVNVLNRGYSITMVNEKVLKTVDGIKQGFILKTILADGNIISITSAINKTE